jgi:hypothetical protein
MVSDSFVGSKLLFLEVQEGHLSFVDPVLYMLSDEKVVLKKTDFLSNLML